MKKYLAISGMALVMSTCGAYAQSASANLNAASEATSYAQSNSRAQGGNVYITEPASRTVRNTGTTTIRSAPQVVAPSMSSGHPCAFAPISVGVSVIGFGGAFGGQRIDDACLLAQMGYRAPSVSMIAARNPQACAALEVTGTIPAGYCNGSYRRTVYAQPQPRYVPKAGVKQVKAVKVAGGKQARIVQAGKVTTFQKASSNCKWVTPATGRYKVQKCS